MEEAQAGVLQDFLAITGVEDPVAATGVLEACNWVLEDAVNLQFATGGDLGHGGGGGGPTAGAAAAAAAPPDDDDDVRAPLPVVRERLYGDHAAGPHGVPALGVARYGAPPDRGPAHVDVFRDFGPDGEAGGSGGAGAGSSGGGAAPKLSDLFKPPAGLAFAGDWAAAVAAAAAQGRWLLVNVQTADEFASHQLNRDTWGQGLVQDMIRGTFVFWQCYDSSDQGKELVGRYHLGALPATLIVDPVTAAKLWERPGFIGAEALVEELVPYMDVGPNDPGASDLAHRAFQQSAKRRNRGAGAGAGSGPGGVMTEDEQLALALAMSAEQQPGGSGSGGGGGEVAMEEELDEEAIWREIQRRQQEEDAAAAAGAAGGGGQAGAPTAAAPAAAAAAPAQPAPAEPAAGAVDVPALQAAAAGRLPPEPADGAPGSCRVAFRLPDGRRVQRRFNASDTVAALQDFCVAESAEVAALPSFALAEARPGAAPLERGASIEAAGVANAMLVVKS
ncbi:PUX7 [Scenedesmus sp. PABB004]|nr:PUX7 [Scenedesmus sp. PABB004]